MKPGGSLRKITCAEMSRASRLIWLAMLVLSPVPAAAVECGALDHEGLKYTVCQVDASEENLQLFLRNPGTGAPLGSFDNVQALLDEDDRQLRFAMNAGMYHENRAPVGHYVQDGREVAPLITRAGPGNFGLLPNGVFCIGDARAEVIETSRFERENPACRHASQSGPMLVIDGELHPRFLPDSDSRYIRNGVGTSGDGRTAWFVISAAPVTFHEFGRLFRDVLKAPQALYFDGNISRLYAPDIGRHDGGFPMGPIVGVVGGADD